MPFELFWATMIPFEHQAESEAEPRSTVWPQGCDSTTIARAGSHGRSDAKRRLRTALSICRIRAGAPLLHLDWLERSADRDGSFALAGESDPSGPGRAQEDAGQLSVCRTISAAATRSAGGRPSSLCAHS